MHRAPQLTGASYRKKHEYYTLLRRCEVLYTALYRKYRPQNFAQVVGQETIVTALQNQVNSGRIGHAYLFTGTRGTGKTSCAKIFAKAVNCLHTENGEPCGVCETCVGIGNGSIFDVVEIDAASNNGVDNVRELREETAYVPAVCKYKVYIIDEVHMLSGSAFNALLKIMEEPPEHVIFILATTESHKVPATVLSRCQRFDFQRIPTAKIAGQLLHVAKNEEIKIEENAATLIARLADGAVRDALSLMDTCITVNNGKVTESVVRSVAGIIEKGNLFDLSNAINTQNMEEVFTQAEQILSRSAEVKRLTEELIFHYRNMLLAGFASSNEDMFGTGAEYFEQYKQAAKEIAKEDIIRAIKTLGSTLDKIGKGADPRIEFELALIALCSADAFVEAASKKQAPTQIRPQVQPPKQEERVPQVGETQQKEVQKQEPTQSESQATPKKALEVEESLAEWGNIIEKMAQRDPMLYGLMSTTNAYISEGYVLIDGNDAFMEFMRANNASAELLKDIIEETLETRYAIKPYKKVETDDTSPNIKDGDVETLIEKLERSGVPIEYD